MPDHTDPVWLREAYRDMSQTEMAEAAGVTSPTISRHMKKHGIKATNGIPEERLREDLLHVADKLDRVPGQREYDSHGKYSWETVASTFGDDSWNNALIAVGLEPNMLRNIDTEYLREDLLRVADELNQTPGIKEYEKLGKYSYRSIANAFGDGSWNNALRVIGLKPKELKNISANALRDDLLLITNMLNRVPGQREYDKHGKYSYETVARKLGDGSWVEALRSVDLWPIEYGGVAMRSSYEPAVAQRLDETGTAWEYEPEQLQTDAGGYTPDFVLDDGTIVEVKGMPRLRNKAPKFEELMEDRRVVVIGTEWWRGRLPCDEFVLYDDVGSFEP